MLISIYLLVLLLKVFQDRKKVGKEYAKLDVKHFNTFIAVENIGGGRKTASPKPEEEPTEEFDIKKYVEDQLRFSKNPYYDED